MNSNKKTSLFFQEDRILEGAGRQVMADVNRFFSKERLEQAAMQDERMRAETGPGRHRVDVAADFMKEFAASWEDMNFRLQRSPPKEVLAAINRDLVYVDVWENVNRRIKIANLKGKVDCPCCRRGKFEWLEGEHGAQTTSLCGRNAVQVSHRVAGKLDFDTMARELAALGKVSFNKFLLKFDVDDYQFTVFPDGRAIIKGTADPDKAKTLYAKYVGH